MSTSSISRTHRAGIWLAFLILASAFTAQGLLSWRIDRRSEMQSETLDRLSAANADQAFTLGQVRGEAQRLRDQIATLNSEEQSRDIALVQGIIEDSRIEQSTQHNQLLEELTDRVTALLERQDDQRRMIGETQQSLEDLRSEFRGLEFPEPVEIMDCELQLGALCLDVAPTKEGP